MQHQLMTDHHLHTHTYTNTIMNATHHHDIAQAASAQTHDRWSPHTYIQKYKHIITTYHHDIAQAASAQTHDRWSPHWATVEKLFWSGLEHAAHSTCTAKIC